MSLFHYLPDLFERFVFYEVQLLDGFQVQFPLLSIMTAAGWPIATRCRGWRHGIWDVQPQVRDEKMLHD